MVHQPGTTQGSPGGKLALPRGELDIVSPGARCVVSARSRTRTGHRVRGTPPSGDGGRSSVAIRRWPPGGWGSSTRRAASRRAGFESMRGRGGTVRAQEHPRGQSRPQSNGPRPTRRRGGRDGSATSSRCVFVASAAAARGRERQPHLVARPRGGISWDPARTAVGLDAWSGLQRGGLREEITSGGLHPG